MAYLDKYPPHKQRAIHRNRTWYALVMAETECAKCGKQPPIEDWPIEWHHHTRTPRHASVAALVKLGASIARILEEMDRCSPLCRRCHMHEDGRAAQLTANKPMKKGVRYAPQLPDRCVRCGRRKAAYRPGICKQCKYP